MNKLEGENIIDIITAIITALITLAFLNSSKNNKTSIQLMLLGIEITIIGAVLLLTVIFLNSTSTGLFLLGIALIVIGFIINLFGFSKNKI